MFKQKTAYDVLIIDWRSDVCSSDLGHRRGGHRGSLAGGARLGAAAARPAGCPPASRRGRAVLRCGAGRPAGRTPGLRASLVARVLGRAEVDPRPRRRWLPVLERAADIGSALCREKGGYVVVTQVGACLL